jgi:hypothetical protein
MGLFLFSLLCWLFASNHASNAATEEPDFSWESFSGIFLLLHLAQSDLGTFSWLIL